jgi:CheY-like chemotaxis protein
MDGCVATRRLREAGYRLPIIALSADATTGEREEGLEAGCDEYATKPIDRRQLISLVARWTQKRSKA